jgi:hypothetical protein
MNWQHVHPCVSVQVIVPECACQSGQIRTGCCTFLLYESPLLPTGSVDRAGRRRRVGLSARYPQAALFSSRARILLFCMMSRYFVS